MTRLVVNVMSPVQLVLSLLLLLLLGCSPPCFVAAAGKGPIHVYPLNDDIVWIADSSLPGIVSVSLKRGVALERFNMMEQEDESVREERAVGIATCPTCNFCLFSAAKNKLYRIDFGGGTSVQEMLDSKRDDIFFRDATVQRLELRATRGAFFAEAGLDVRMLILHSDGTRAVVASSDDAAVYKLNLIKKQVKVTRIFPTRGKPFGVTFDASGKRLLVTMHHNKIYRITFKGKILQKYLLTEANQCPNAALEPNLRESLDDPLYPNEAILVLASQPRSYDAALWRLNYVTGECTMIAGRTGVNSGWLDGQGTDIRFSRPHGMALLPRSSPDDDWKLVISDIDNRALRILNLVTLQSSTVMYDLDRRVQERHVEQLQSSIDCFDVQVPRSRLAESPLGLSAVVITPDKTNGVDLTFVQAQDHCAAQGMRLCYPSELRESRMAPNYNSWTLAECASCWKKHFNRTCDNDIVNFRTGGGAVHSTPLFQHSWNDGRAYEVGRKVEGGPATICTANETFLAAAPCCADCA